nr:hypothetical protein CFP56_78772 [Quercus suber]
MSPTADFDCDFILLAGKASWLSNGLASNFSWDRFLLGDWGGDVSMATGAGELWSGKEVVSLELSDAESSSGDSEPLLDMEMNEVVQLKPLRLDPRSHVSLPCGLSIACYPKRFMKMVCDICFRNFTPERQPLCPSCAQVLLYHRRLSQAQALCEREEAHIHAEAVVRPGNDGILAALPPDADLEAITIGIQRHAFETHKADIRSFENSTKNAIDKAKELREEIETCKKYAAIQHEAHRQHRHNLMVERRRLVELRAKAIEAVHTDALRAEKKLQKVHARTAHARATLCREVAVLSGLKRRSNNQRASDYTLGGSPIFDLKHLNGDPTNDMSEPTRLEKLGVEPNQHEIINASLGSICRLLVQCCHYLHVRLPAEIVLPHIDCPSAMIFPERASYKNRDISETTLQLQRSSSLTASTLLDRSSTSRPRPLTIDRSLSQLSKDDSKSFNMFVEGVALLAWDVAWLCKAQGVTSVSDFNDISAIGRNLYNLFLSRDAVLRPPLDRNISSATNTSRAKPPSEASSLQLGVFSHGSVRNSLSGPDIAQLLRNWKYASPTRLADRLKTHLLNDLSHREWDEIDGNEWVDEFGEDHAVAVGGSRTMSNKQSLANGILTVSTMDGADDGRTRASKTKEGWMRVRNREGEV